MVEERTGETVEGSGVTRVRTEVGWVGKKLNCLCLCAFLSLSYLPVVNTLG